MKTATITFHSAYNYGSMLQAFALQKIIQKLECDNDIINLRTEIQKFMYDYKSCKGNFVKRTVYKIVILPFAKDLAKRGDLFELFLERELKLTQEYSSYEELKYSALKYDCFIAGSDQIWNTSAYDFDESYLLSFIKTGKKIAYAVSVGPNIEKVFSNSRKLKKELPLFTHISVREDGTRRIIKDLTGKDTELVLDPTLLLDVDDWKNYSNQRGNISDVNDEYALMYSPFLRNEVVKAARIIHSIHKVNVINTIFFPRRPILPGIQNRFATGPWEFIHLLEKSKFVISGSYHAVAFSILFHKPFIAIDGMHDNRIKTLLENTGLINRSVSSDNLYSLDMDFISNCNFDVAERYLKLERKRSIEYLRNAIFD